MNDILSDVFEGEVINLDTYVQTKISIANNKKRVHISSQESSNITNANGNNDD